MAKKTIHHCVNCNENISEHSLEELQICELQRKLKRVGGE